jgi:WD40 repeat protein
MVDGRSVLAVDTAGSLTALSLDGGTPTELFATGGAPLYALAIRPGKAEAVVGGRIPKIHRFTLPTGRENARWPFNFQGVTVLAYSPDGQWLAEGDASGHVALRNADTGAIERRLIGLEKQVTSLLPTRTHLWAGGADQRLVRWSLTGGTEPDLPPIDEGSYILNLAATADGRFLIVALGDGRAAVHALPDGALVAHLLPLRDGSWATIHADGRYEASSGEALALRFEDRTTRKVTTLGHLPDPLSFGQVSATRLPEGPVRVRATVFSSHGPPQVRLDERWTITAITPSPTSLTAYEIDFLLADLTETPHRLHASA